MPWAVRRTTPRSSSGAEAVVAVVRAAARRAAEAARAAAAAHGDVGARDLLEMHSAVVDLVDCSDLDDGADVDVPKDLHRLTVVSSRD